MASRASIAGHPIHPMLVVFPIGLWVFSFISDLVFFGGGSEIWRTMAFYTMAGGVIGALAAAIFGFIDFTGIRDEDTRRIGLTHMALNLLITALFLVNLYWRTRTGIDAAGPVWLSALAILLLLVSGWLGGEMVYVRGQAVAPEALMEKPIPVPIERRRPGVHAYTGPERRHAPAYAPKTE